MTKSRSGFSGSLASHNTCRPPGNDWRTDDATSIQRRPRCGRRPHRGEFPPAPPPPPSHPLLPPLPRMGEQADSGRDYMATDGECSKEFFPASSLICNIFGNIDYACLAVNLAICPCTRACGLRASLRPSKSPNGRQTRRWRAIAEEPRAAWDAHLQWIGKGRPTAAASDSTLHAVAGSASDWNW